MPGTTFLDTRSVLVISVLLIGLMGVVSLGFARVQHGTRALGLWGWCSLLLAAGLALIALRGFVPNFFGIVVANGLLLWSAIVMLRSVRSFHAQPGRDIAGWVAFAVAMALIAYWTYVSPNLVARITAYSAIISLLLARVAVYLFRTLPAEEKLAQAFTASVTAVFSALSALRALLTILGETIHDFMTPSYLQSISIIGYLVGFLTGTLGIMWMEIQHLQSDLRTHATIDELTALMNRRAFLEAARREISHAHRSGETLGLAMFDLDHFKRVNDQHGHLAGDRVLRLFADTLRHAVRPHDLVGRYGGEEFVLLMPDADKAAAVAVAERCRRAVETQSLGFGGGEIKVTTSAGVAAWREDGDELDSMLAAADAALYQAKAAGRNCVIAA